MKQFGPWFEKRGYWYDYDRRLAYWTKSDEDYFYARIAPRILALCQKWEIGNFFPPNWKFDKAKGIHRISGYEWGLPTGISAEMNWDLDFLSKLSAWGFTSNVTSGRRHKNILAVEFDLNWPMKDLITHVKRLLASGQKSYRKELAEHGIRPRRGRRRLQDYDEHLKIWDLRQKRWTLTQIAENVFGDKSEFGVGRVRDHLKAARKLISGHYREIS